MKKKVGRNLLGVAIIAIALSAVQTANAQGSTAGLYQIRTNASAGNYYYVSKPGELTMEVNIWGSVRSPGTYEVPTSTNLIQLVSYSGGPTSEASLDEVRVTRFLKKEGGGFTRQLFVVNLEDLYRSDETQLILHPGDTVFIDHTSWSALRDVFTVVATAALVTSALAQVISASNRR